MRNIKGMMSMSLLNNNTINGYIKTEIELKETKQGKSYTRILLSVADHYYKEDTFTKRYQVLPFIAFGKEAEKLEKRVIKGQYVIVQFKLSQQVIKESQEDERGLLVPQLIVTKFETLESPDAVKQRQNDSQQNEDEKVDPKEEEHVAELEKESQNIEVNTQQSTLNQQQYNYDFPLTADAETSETENEVPEELNQKYNRPISYYDDYPL